MDFVVGLPMSSKGNNEIWVIADILTKSAHFLPIKTAYSLDKLAKLYIDQIIRLHGVPEEIISYRGLRFISGFW